MQRHPICMPYSDHYYILDEIEHQKQTRLNKIIVLIVMSNITDGKNHSEILYVAVHYILIKCLYLNVIWFFILVCYHFFVYSFYWCFHVSPF